MKRLYEGIGELDLELNPDEERNMFMRFLNFKRELDSHNRAKDEDEHLHYLIGQIYLVKQDLNVSSALVDLCGMALAIREENEIRRRIISLPRSVIRGYQEELESRIEDSVADERYEHTASLKKEKNILAALLR